MLLTDRRTGTTSSVVKTRIAIGYVYLAAYASLFAASPYTETFDSSLQGWRARGNFSQVITNQVVTNEFNEITTNFYTNVVTNFFMTVTNMASGGNPGGCLRGSFAASGGPTPIEVDAFAATGALATTNFIGDYQGAQIDLIGLDVRAEKVLPSEVLVKLIGNGTTFFRSIKAGLAATGTWYSFAISLDSLSAGGWSGGSADQFRAALTNITAVEIQITRAGTSGQNYLLDNIYVASLPEATAQATGGDDVQITWSNLRSNELYRAEASSAADQSWSLLESFTATGTVHAITDTNAAPQRAYRLLIE